MFLCFVVVVVLGYYLVLKKFFEVGIVFFLNMELFKGQVYIGI